VAYGFYRISAALPHEELLLRVNYQSAIVIAALQDMPILSSIDHRPSSHHLTLADAYAAKFLSRQALENLYNMLSSKPLCSFPCH
jgi:hypothetical protein